MAWEVGPPSGLPRSVFVVWCAVVKVPWCTVYCTWSGLVRSRTASCFPEPALPPCRCLPTSPPHHLSLLSNIYSSPCPALACLDPPRPALPSQPAAADAKVVDKKKFWDAVQPALRTDGGAVATLALGGQRLPMNTSAGAVRAPSLTGARIA
mgnify:CR=1 FL=1